MKPSNTRISAAVACVCLAPCGRASAQSYTLRPLPPPGAGMLSRGHGLHESGPVVGTGSPVGTGQRQPMRWTNGVPEVLALPPHPQFGGVTGGTATDVEAGGRIAGTARFTDFRHATAFAWRAGVGVLLPLPAGRTYAEAYGVWGPTVVGYSIAFDGTTPYGWVPCVWDVGPQAPTLAILPTLGGPAAAFDINASGDIAGWSEEPSGTPKACLWRAGVPQSLGTLGGPASGAWGLNARAAVVGDAETPGGAWHAFLHDGGPMADLGVLPGFGQSIAMEVNDRSEAVGWVYNGSNPFAYAGSERAFVWRNGAMRDLNTLIPPGIGWVLVHAWAIDNLGRITGWGTTGGQPRGYLLVPCSPDCDTSTGPGVLDIFDFLCFQNRYDAGDPYACACDTGSGPGLCDIFDFLCFQNAFAAGCP